VFSFSGLVAFLVSSFSSVAFLVNFYFSSTGFLVSVVTCLREIDDLAFGVLTLDLVADLAAMGLTAFDLVT